MSSMLVITQQVGRQPQIRTGMNGFGDRQVAITSATYNILYDTSGLIPSCGSQILSTFNF